MANENLNDAKEWLSFAEADLGVATIDEKYYNYADILTPYAVSMRYPNELFLEERHAVKAIDMAKEFVDWAKISATEK